MPTRRSTTISGNQLTAPQYVVAVASWNDESPLPAAQVHRLALQLESLRALSGVRRHVRSFLVSGLAVEGTDAGEDAVDRAVLVIDELASNALRHGRAPSQLHVVDDGDRWIVVVSDSAPEWSPTPARDRPAGHGGYGLYVVADLSTEYGVHYEPDRKMVWAALAKPTT